MEKRILISIVCYKNENEIIGFVEMVNNFNIDVCVTYNAGDRYSYLIERLKEYNVICFNPNKNLGYLNGCLYGIKQLENINQYDWICICNTDIRMDSSLFFNTLTEKKYSKDVWCVAPRITLLGSDIDQNPFLVKRISKKKFTFLRTIYSGKILFSVYCFMGVLKKTFNNKTSENVTKKQFIYSAHGCFFILQPKCIKRLLLDNNEIFLYGEEIYISEVIRQERKKVIYDPELRIEHNENQSTGLVMSSSKQKWFKDSFTFLEKYFK